MSFAGGRRIMYSALVVLLIILVLQIWVLSDCGVGALRLYPSNSVANEKQKRSMEVKKSMDELFREYLHRRPSDLNSTAQNAFQDDKRRVPSCPDPLHNR